MTAISRQDRAHHTTAAQDAQAIRELRYFAHHAWSIVEPGRPLTWNWHLSLVCDELQDFTRPIWDSDSPDPDCTEMVVCVPPRSLKSYLTAICLHAWLWLRAPWMLLQGISNDEDLSTRDSRKTMQLIQSAWYQNLLRHQHTATGGDPFGPLPWSISKTQAAKANWLNSLGGGRTALGVNSQVTGKGADLQLFDDPYDAKQATRGAPDAVKRRMDQVVHDYDEVLRSRLNTPSRSLRLVIMQRLDPSDLAGELIRRGARCVVLPMVFDPDFPAELGGVHPRDPRFKAGQLLMPARWSAKVWSVIQGVRDASRHISAQYNQRPTPPEGNLFKKHWFDRRFQGPPDMLRVDEISIFIDCTFKETGGSWVVMQVWGRKGKAQFYMLDQVREKVGFVGTVRLVLNLRKKWHRVRRVVIEDKANGTATLDLLKDEIPGLIAWDPGVKSKYERAQVGSAPPLEAGQVHYPADKYAPWLEGYKNRHIAFDGSGSTPDDEIDTTSMALLKWTGGAEHPLDRLKKRLPRGLVR